MCSACPPLLPTAPTAAERNEFLPQRTENTKALGDIQTKEQLLLLANLLDKDRGHDEQKIAEDWWPNALLMIQALRLVDPSSDV